MQYPCTDNSTIYCNAISMCSQMTRGIIMILNTWMKHSIYVKNSVDFS